jgi:anaerobic carbon-monoxide dehydrogenase iron sulfur subunit
VATELGMDDQPNRSGTGPPASGPESASSRLPVVDLERCTGCRTCELACSFHHTGAFAPASSSIRIGRSNRTAEMEWVVEASCDLCAGEPEQSCVRYCQYEAVTAGRKTGGR